MFIGLTRFILLTVRTVNVIINTHVFEETFLFQHSEIHYNTLYKKKA